MESITENKDLTKKPLYGFSIIFYIYFFINTVGIPHGLYYTTLMVPLFYLWLIKKRAYKFPIIKYFLFFSPFVLVHLITGIKSPKDYIISFLLMLCLYVTALTFYYVFKNYRMNEIFDKVIRFNFGLTIIALMARPTPFRDIFWWTEIITSYTGPLPRLKLLTYEPSYYSTMIMPLFFYALFSYLKEGNKKNLSSLIMITIPLALSFSFGILGGVSISILIISISYAKVLMKKSRIFSFLVLSLILLVFISPSIYLSLRNVDKFVDKDNIVLRRIENLQSGRDTSTNARAYYSYIFAYRIASMRSSFFGSGWGHIKIYFKYIVHPEKWEGNRIPCASAETLAIFGIVGFIIRYLTLFWFFIRNRVYQNYFSLSVFLTMFLFQLAGSAISNVVEYIAWAIAFSGTFPEFNIKMMNSGVENKNA